MNPNKRQPPDRANRLGDGADPRRFRLDSYFTAQLTARAGLTPAELLERAGLPPDLLNRRHSRVNEAEYAKLWRLLTTQSDTPTTPIEFGAALTDPRPFKSAMVGAACSATCRGALERLSTYRNDQRPTRIALHEVPQGLRVELLYESGGRCPTNIGILALAFLVIALRRLSETQVVPLKVEFADAQAASPVREGWFGTSIAPSNRWSVTFDNRTLALPVAVDPRLWMQDLPAALDPIAQPHDAPRTAARRALVRQVLAGTPRVGAVANALGCSPRTLQRRLADAGTTFQSLLHEVRRDLARWLLDVDGLDNQTIAWLLAYDSEISFYRAFNQWTGTSPDQYREAQGA